MKKLLIFILIFMSSAAVTNGGETGSLYISIINLQDRWQRDAAGRLTETVFTLVIDDVHQVVISKEKDAKIHGLALGKRHFFTVSRAGRRDKKFYFTFEDYQCSSLWLYYDNLYGVWKLKKI